MTMKGEMETFLGMGKNNREGNSEGMSVENCWKEDAVAARDSRDISFPMRILQTIKSYDFLWNFGQNTRLCLLFILKHLVTLDSRVVGSWTDG